jgi:hypothetical protein
MTYTSPNWTDPITWGIALGLLVLLTVQGWFIVRNQTLSPGRKLVRTALNGLLWLVLVAYVLQISWTIDRPATHALLVGEEVPAAYARNVQDSLHIRERLPARSLKAAFDSVTLVGQDFTPATLAKLSRSVVRWVPYTPPGQLQELHWKGVVRQGEIQRVTGRMALADKQLLRSQYGSRTLDSVMLAPGNTAFTLQFPAFGQGQTQVEIMLGKEVLDTIRFFSRPTTPLQVQFVLDNPDFESKTLADWLGRQGHSVQLSTTLARNVRSSTGINMSSKGGTKKPDLIVTDPANAGSSAVRTAMADGKAVLFINLGTPTTDVAIINRALKTRWQLKRTSPQESVPAGSNLTAHPFQFGSVPNQFAIVGYPIAVQQTAGRVGVSLLNETFPLALSGDSVAYSRIWQAVLAKLQPAEKNNILIDAPTYSGLPAVIRVNNPTVSTTRLRIGADTVRLVSSPLNRQSTVGRMVARNTGWQALQDSLAVYVEPSNPQHSLAARQVVAQLMRAHLTYGTTVGRPGQPSLIGTTQRETLPNWVWLTVLVICLTALWVEPKVG